MLFVGDGLTLDEVLNQNTYYVRYAVQVTIQNNDGSEKISVYYDSSIVSMETRRSLYKDNKPSIGGLVSAELELEMLDFDFCTELNYINISRDNSKISYRPVLCFFSNADNTEVARIYEEYFFPDRTELNVEDGRIIIHAYDRLGNAESPIRNYGGFPKSSLYYAGTITDIVSRCCHALGNIETNIIEDDFGHIYTIDPNNEILFQVYFEDKLSEVLEKIALLGLGNLIIKDDKLTLIKIFDVPSETFYLITENHNRIVFGEDRIILRESS